jgi:hypothetical protein
VLSVKATVSFVATEPPEPGVIVAVKTTDVPDAEEFPEADDTTLVVDAGSTFCVSVPLLVL